MIFENSSSKVIFRRNIRNSTKWSVKCGSRFLQEAALNYIFSSAKVRTSVRHFPGLALCPVKEIEPTTSGVDHQRSNRLSYQVRRELVVGISSHCERVCFSTFIGTKPSFVDRCVITKTNMKTVLEVTGFIF